MQSSYDHLFFDLDHTLWDFEGNALECLAEMYENFNLLSLGVENFDDFYINFSEANRHYWALLERKEITVDELRKKRFKTAFHKLGIDITEEFGLKMTDVFLELLPHKTKLIEGTIEVLDYLKPHYQLHIISNGWQDIQVKKMENSGILHYFDAIITNEIANARKPEKGIFDHALKQTNASFSRSLMIGDNYEADILGAKNADFDTVFYNPEKQETIEKPTFEIFKLTDMKAFL
jgi:YjjG family noncanonical pyrimidine nucleotidase